MISFLRRYYNYFLWRLGIRKVLPAYFIRRVPVRENGEKLVPWKGKLVREGVRERLIHAESLLPNGYQLCIREGYRSLNRQRMLWEKRFQVLRSKYPTYSREEIERLTTLGTARGTGNGPHQSGGAVDVCLLNEQGNPIPMGTNIIEFNEKTPTENPYLTHEERKNRAILVSAMLGAGFINYPAEWWHYSYGDQMWAAYSRKPFAVYKAIHLKKK